MSDMYSDSEDECSDKCLYHADWCDGYCNHVNHVNMCLVETNPPFQPLR